MGTHPKRINLTSNLRRRTTFILAGRKQVSSQDGEKVIQNECKACAFTVPRLQKKTQKCLLFRCLSTKYVKDEPPDTWDEEEQSLEGDKEEEEKKTLERKDKDLEFLFQEVQRNGSLDDQLKRELQEKKSEPKYKEMLVSSYLLKPEKRRPTCSEKPCFDCFVFIQQFREKLPSYGKKEVSLWSNFFPSPLTLTVSSDLLPSLHFKELVALINSNRVVVVSGETGCGKTTQVTQFILDDHISRGMGSICRVVCTQPRRISAISVCFSFYRLSLNWIEIRCQLRFGFFCSCQKINLISHLHSHSGGRACSSGAG